MRERIGQLKNKNPALKFDLLFCSILFAYALVFILFHTPSEWYNDDSVTYLGSAKSIVEDHSYTYNFAPQTKFPPGYPIFLVFLVNFSNKGFSDNDLFVSGTALLGLLGVAAVYRFFRKRSPKGALIISLLLLFSPYFFSHAIKDVASDLPYLAFSFLAMLSSQRLESQKKLLQKIIWGVLFTLFLSFSLLTRSIGITLLAAYGLYTIMPMVTAEFSKALQRIKIYALPLGISFVCVMLWFYWSSRNRVIYYTGQYMDSYFTQIRFLNPHQPDSGLASATDLLLRIFNNVIMQLSHFGEMLIHHNWLVPSPVSPFVIIPCLILVITLFKRVADAVLAKRHLTTIEGPFLYLLLYLGMLLVWPFDEGQRFIMPIFPILCWYLYDGVKQFMHAREEKSFKIDLLLTGISIAAGVLALLNISLYHAKGIQHYAYLLIWVTITVYFSASLLCRMPSIRAKVNQYAKLLPRKNSNKIATFCYIFFVITICLYGLAQEVMIVYELHSNTPETTRNSNYVQAAVWLKENASANTVIAATHPGVPHWFSGMKVVPLPVTVSSDILLDAIRKNGVQYILTIDEGPYPYYLPLDEERVNIIKETNKTSLELVNTGKMYKIYEVKASF